MKSNYASLPFKVKVTKEQKEILNFFRSNAISCLTGDPGTGKTFMAVYFALQELNNKTYDKIIITKPLIEVGRSMGYLPGTKLEKIADYMRSYTNIFEKILGTDPFRALLNAKRVVFEPVNFCRGDTYDYSLIILDESQNMSLHELITFTTRVASTSKTIVIGDDWQSDIKNSGYETFINEFTNIEGIAHTHLGEEFQMRNSMIIDIYKRYKEFLSK